jgi:hypothetical protein
MKFERNIGDADRAVRAVVGLVLLYLIISAAVQAPATYLLGLASIAFLFTAVTGSCKLYSLLKIKTCPRKIEK